MAGTVAATGPDAENRRTTHMRRREFLRAAGAGALGAALLIGESARGEEADVLTAGVPLYAVGAIAPEGAKRRVLTAPPGAGGGTILREDGMPVSPEKRESGGLPTLLDVLEWMIGEARA